MDKLKTPITNKEVDLIRKVATQKSSGADGLTVELCQTFKEELILIFHKLLQNIELEETNTQSFYEVSFNFIEKPYLKIHKKKV